MRPKEAHAEIVQLEVAWERLLREREQLLIRQLQDIDQQEQDEIRKRLPVINEMMREAERKMDEYRKMFTAE